MATADPGFAKQSCVRCAERKVKCDRKRPCNACIRHEVDCIYKAPQPPRNRHKRLNVQILSDRLKHYEALFREKGIDPSAPDHAQDSETARKPEQEAQKLDLGAGTASNESQRHTPLPSPADSQKTLPINKPQVLKGQGRFKFVDNTLWTRMTEELNHPDDALGDSDPDDSEAFDEDFSSILGTPPDSDTKTLHPSPEDIRTLWKIFVENVDPLLKVLHVPTVQPAIERASRDIMAMPKSFETLLFAIYSAAVMSLSDEDCRRRLGESRKVLLARYTSATRAALSRARFMETTRLIVLQALLIYLIAVRDSAEPRAVWSLTGVAVRLAQNMGLERDGELLGMTPFETEMRRRIWWQLKMHDFQAAEHCGVSKFRDLDVRANGAKWPANVNDDQLYPTMTESPPIEPGSITDAVLVSIRASLVNFASERVAGDSNPENVCVGQKDLVEMDKHIEKIQEHLETRYIRYCDPSQPLHLMAMLMSRCAMNYIRFLSHHPRRWGSIEQTPPLERELVWGLSTKLLEQQNMLQTNPQLKRFAWIARYTYQWQAVIHVLDVLQANPGAADAERTWGLIRDMYANNPYMISHMRKPIHIAVGSLCLKAYCEREAVLQRADASPPPTPHFIVQLRQQLEAAKQRRRERQVQKLCPGSCEQSLASKRDTEAESDAAGDKPVQSTAPPQAGSAAASMEQDPFWFTHEEANTQSGLVPGLNMDLDFILDQADGSNQHNINWELWDVWLR